MNKIANLSLVVILMFLFVGCSAQHQELAKQVAMMIDNQLAPKIKKEKDFDIIKNHTKNEIYLKVNHSWHKNTVEDLLITKDKKKMITVSNGKDILISDIKTGKVTQKIIGEIGHGNFGNIMTIALSSDNKYLVSAGVFGYDTDLSKEGLLNSGALRVYDFKNLKMKKLLLSQKEFVADVEFSPDNKYLVSYAVDGIINVWDVKNWKLKKQFNTYSSINEIKIIKDNDKYILFAVEGSVGGIKSYDLEKGYLLGKKKGTPLTQLAIGQNEIAVGTYTSSKEVTIYDFKLNKIDTISLNRGVGSLEYSKDGKYLLAGIYPSKYTDTNYDGVKIIDRKNNNKIIAHFTKNDDLIKVAKFLNKTEVISVGSTENSLFIWNIQNQKVIKEISDSNSFISLGVKGNKIAIGNTYYTDSKKNSLNNRGPFSKSFDLNTMKMSYDIKGFKRLKTEEKNNKIAPFQKNNQIYMGYFEDNSLKSKLSVDSSISAIGLSNNLIVSGGIYPKVYNSYFQNIADLNGHEGTVWAINQYKDFLITTGVDNIINFWDLSNLKKDEYNLLSPKLSLYIAENDELIIWTPAGYFNSSENGYKNIGFHLNKGYDKNADWIDIEKLYDHFYRPDLVKLALSGKDIRKYTNGITFKDVLKNPPPQIKITKANKKAISNQIVKHNEGNIDLQFNINQIDNGGVGIIRVYQEGKLVKTIGQGKINRKSANVVEDLKTAELNKKAEHEQKEYLASLEDTVTKSINGTVNVNELVQMVSHKSSNNKAGTFNIKLPLKAGKNNISIEAFNKTNTVVSIRENIIVDASIPKLKPTVYAIVAGVNEFESTGRFSNLKYSENDAKAVKDILKNKIKGKIEVKFLIGKDLTKENLSKAVSEIKKKARLEDSVVFYISTHGKAIRGNLYLVPQNNKRAKNWIKFEELFKEVQSINALQQVFIVDACESGKAKDIVASIYDSKASVLAKQSGVHVLLATTKGTFAFEHPNPKIKHGVFTNNILTALNDMSTDKNKDKKISVIELSKVLKSPKYTAKQQYPVIRNVGNDVKMRDLK